MEKYSIDLRRSRDGTPVRSSVVRAAFRVPFSSFWPAFTLTVHINALYNESVEGKNMQLELIRFMLKIATSLTLQTL